MRALLLVAALLACSTSRSQNLVPNSSFEDPAACGGCDHPGSPAAWFHIRPDSVNGYFTMSGFPASTGNRYLNFIIGNRLDKFRSYWQTMLLHNLEKGKKYKIGLSINGWNLDPNVNDIGFYFSDTLVACQGGPLLQPADYIKFNDAKVRNLKYKWFRLEKEFTATANSRWLVVGNFSAKDYQEIAKQRVLTSMYDCLILDDILVIPEVKISCEDCPRVRDSLYALNRIPQVKKESPPVDTIATIVKTEKVDTLVINDILFATASYKLSDPDSLERFRETFKAPGIKKIRIIGFTDDTGTEAANKALSQKRALEIGRLLPIKFGVPDAVIQAEGGGISTTCKEKSKNRRVEVYIYR